MEPTVWGPSAWTFLHSITLNYPEQPSEKDKLQTKEFFESIGNVLPCPVCRHHYIQTIQEIPIQLNSKDDLVHWLIDIHNKVNQITNKKEISYDEFHEIYKTMYSMQTTNYTRIILVFVLIVLLYKLYEKYN